MSKSKSLSLTNSKDIICNSIALIIGNDVINLTDLFLFKSDAIKDIIGLAPEDLNSLSELAASLNNNSDFSKTITDLLKLKASIIYVDNELFKKANLIDVYTNTQISKLLFLKSNKDESYTITDINNFFYSKTVVDEKLILKANLVDVYTNTQINKLLFLKSNR